MAEQPHTIQAFESLGAFLSAFCKSEKTNDLDAFESLDRSIALAGQRNGWFTRDNILFALEQWSQVLTKQQLSKWVANYSFTTSHPKSVAIIMAGNIPLVGFHDFLSVLLSGNKAICKLSSNDTVLLPFLANLLSNYEPSLVKHIEFVKGKLENYDVVIATGSNNTSRYFEYYFGNKPNIIRKNRTSVAVLTGDETADQLKLLGIDVFKYYGLGCRNVSKLFVPRDYNFDAFFNAMYSHQDIIEHHKYANNYDYNKAVYLMSDFKILDNGFMILKEDSSMHSPISVLYYEHYDSIEELEKLLKEQQEYIQCVVSQIGIGNEVAFGQTQRPKLDDYADGVDTLQFLITL